MDDERVELAWRAENFGVAAQRVDAIRRRFRRFGWVPEVEDGVIVRMRWCPVQWVR
jgi:hypothetical protein